MESRSAASQIAVMDGASAAKSASTAEECNRILGQDWAEDEEELHRDLVQAEREREPSAWKQFEVFTPAEEGNQ